MVVLSSVALGGAEAAVAAEAAVPGRTELRAPAYRADLADSPVAVQFVNTRGKTAKVYAVKAPADDADDAVPAPGVKTLVADLRLDNGRGAFDFAADRHPHGPIALRVEVYGDDAEKPFDTAYFQFFNKVGAPWRNGLAQAPVNPVTEGMKVVFADDFNVMPKLTVEGKDMGETGAAAPDAQHAYATRKVDGTGMFGWAFFADHDDTPYNPFAIVDDRDGNRLMRLTTAYWPEGNVPGASRAWGQKATTGYLSSMGQDGGGFHTKGGRNQYFECRMFLGPNPGHWPAFWLLTANGAVASDGVKAPAFGGPSDEIDILEGYLGTPSGYQATGHQWGYSTGKSRGGWPIVEKAEFGHVNIAMGFHTYAVHITEKRTYYYFDNVKVFEHETLERSWELGNYFIINGGLSDHFGLPKEGDDTFGPDAKPFGFTRYGNECYDYVDWVRVWEDDADTPRFELQQTSRRALPGDYLPVNVDRNAPARALSGQYRVTFPAAGWKVWDAAASQDGAGAGAYVPATGQAAVIPFAADAARDSLLFMAPDNADAIVDGGVITIVPVYGDTEYKPGLTVALSVGDARGVEVAFNKQTFPHRGKDGKRGGAWTNFDPDAYDDNPFTFGGGWWNEGWSWMHNRSNSTGALEFAFEGNAFELHHIVYSGGAEYQVYFDGALAETLSNAAADEKVELAWRWEDPESRDAPHTVKIVSVAPGAHAKHIRFDAFKYWYRDDVSKPRYTLAGGPVTVTRDGPVKPGDTIEIRVDRNAATGSTYGRYTVQFPDYTAAYGKAGYQLLSAESLNNRPQDTIRIQLPAHADWKDKTDVVILQAPAGSGFAKPLKVRIAAPK